MACWKNKLGRWEVEVYWNGHAIHCRCPPGTTKAEAKALEAKFKADQRARRLGQGRTGDKTYHEVCRGKKTLKEGQSVFLQSQFK
jgi:hypothetical protein